jgi:hypothetical protein
MHNGAASTHEFMRAFVSQQAKGKSSKQENQAGCRQKH